MNYAIIRNTKYTTSQLSVVYRHNERKNTNYSNKDINKQLSKVNYSIKECNTTYEKRFKDLKEEYDLQGKIKSISNVACEYIITASPEFFEGLAEDASKYNFHPTQKGKYNEDGTYTVTFKASGSREIIWHVFKWGAGCKILSPKSLRDEYKKYLVENVENY